MRRLLRQDGVIALRSLVLLELTVALHHPGVVHADQRVLATAGIEDHPRIAGILTLQDVGPEQVFVMLGRLLSPVHLLDHRPSSFLQQVDGLLVVGGAIRGVEIGRASCRERV